MKTSESSKQEMEQIEETMTEDKEKDSNIPKIDKTKVRKHRNSNHIDEKSIKLKVTTMISRRIMELEELLLNIRRNNVSIKEQQLFLQHNNRTDFPSLRWFEPTSNSTTDLEQTCRICVHSMTKLEKRISLFPEMSGSNFQTDFEELNNMNLKIYRDDGLPQNICAPCATQLEQLKDFRFRAIRAQYILQVYFKRIVKRNDLDDTLDDPNQHMENVGIQFLKEEPPFEIFDSSELDPPLENFRIDKCLYKSYNDKDSNDKITEINENEIFNSDNHSEFMSNDCETTGQLWDHKKIDNKPKLVSSPTPEPNKFVPIGLVKEQRIDDDSCSNEINSIQSTESIAFASRQICVKRAKITRKIKDDPMSNYRFTTRCGICSKTFISFAKRNEHMLIHNKGKPQCKKCDCKFEVKSELTAHYNEVHPSPLICSICNRTFKLYSQLAQHLKFSHNHREYKCQYCDKTYIQMGNLKNHMNTHTGARPFMCTACGRSEPDAFQYNTVLSTHRINCDPSDKRYKSLKCDQCGKSFRRKFDLVRHIRSHTGERPFVCDLCDMRFNQKPQLKVHIMRWHISETRRKVKERRERSIESNLYKYKCKICNKRFRYQPSLTNHMKRHVSEKERKYVCDICKQSFIYYSTVRWHINGVHLRLKKYKCDMCEKTFHERGHLNKHILVHHHTPSEYECHECSHCGKRLRNMLTLRQHMRVHTGENRYHCEMCGAYFTHFSTMKSHYDKNMCGAKGKKPSSDSSIAQ